MDNGHEIRDFLVSRRAKITPEQAGLPAYGGNRGVAGASDSVLGGIVRALQLDEAERAHLFDLARTAPGLPSRGHLAARRRSRCGPACSASSTR